MPDIITHAVLLPALGLWHCVYNSRTQFCYSGLCGFTKTHHILVRGVCGFTKIEFWWCHPLISVRKHPKPGGQNGTFQNQKFGLDPQTKSGSLPAGATTKPNEQQHASRLQPPAHSRSRSQRCMTQPAPTWPRRAATSNLEHSFPVWRRTSVVWALPSRTISSTTLQGSSTRTLAELWV